MNLNEEESDEEDLEILFPEFIDDNPPPWEDLENSNFSLAISGK